MKTTIFYIMKTLHNLNNDMHAHDCPFIPCETFLPFHSLRLIVPFILMLMLVQINDAWSVGVRTVWHVVRTDGTVDR